MIPILNHEALNALEIRVLSIQRTEAARWWNFKHVISPFSRLWLIVRGDQPPVTGRQVAFTILSPAWLFLHPA